MKAKGRVQVIQQEIEWRRNQEGAWRRAGGSERIQTAGHRNGPDSWDRDKCQKGQDTTWTLERRLITGHETRCQVTELGDKSEPSQSKVSFTGPVASWHTWSSRQGGPEPEEPRGAG